MSWRPVQDRPSPKKCHGQKCEFLSLEGYNRFMRPSWVQAHGLISKKVYIVWVCAPRYRPPSSRKNRIREEGLEFRPGFCNLFGYEFGHVSNRHNFLCAHLYFGAASIAFWSTSVLLGSTAIGFRSTSIVFRSTSIVFWSTS